ncbi:hypothetical protein H1P_6530003 [Hyella patelloides LEGE 07179]|uniref:Uncharacterized protein n=1 Tax=Hyella patelloides LEGE 07179 TaxID=945734 RepID=A0A563W2F5_9CYAN|nr:hypothetical protein H1P_6530003 [Hyella patelloides LEGE 07179]
MTRVLILVCDGTFLKFLIIKLQVIIIVDKSFKGLIIVASKENF